MRQRVDGQLWNVHELLSRDITLQGCMLLAEQHVKAVDALCESQAMREQAHALGFTNLYRQASLIKY